MICSQTFCNSCSVLVSQLISKSLRFPNSFSSKTKISNILFSTAAITSIGAELLIVTLAEVIEEIFVPLVK